MHRSRTIANIKGADGTGAGDVTSVETSSTVGNLVVFNSTSGKQVAEIDSSTRAQARAGLDVAPEALSSAHTIDTSHRGGIFLLSGNGWSITHDMTASQAGAGFRYTVKNVGVGTITIDPNGTETIDDATTLKCLAKQEFEVVCDGSNWITIGREKHVVLARAFNASAVGSVELTLLPDYDFYEVEFSCGAAATGTSLFVRVAADGVPNYITTGNYYYNIQYAIGTTPAAAEALGVGYYSITRNHGAAVGADEGYFRIWSGASIVRMMHRAQATYLGGGNRYIEYGGGYINLSLNPPTHIKFYYGTGNVAAGGLFVLKGLVG